MARAPKKSSRLSPEQAVEDIGRLCDHYRLPRNSANASLALHLAIGDGLIKVPRELGRVRGRRSIWQSDKGIELVGEVGKRHRQARREGRKSTIAGIISELQADEEAKWGQYANLEKRYYDAKRYWYGFLKQPK
jgi:hypothetical protein